jgi:hypothetical protein
MRWPGETVRTTNQRGTRATQGLTIRETHEAKRRNAMAPTITVCTSHTPIDKATDALQNEARLAADQQADAHLRDAHSLTSRSEDEPS